jgi:hypothetical protein
MVRIMLIPYTTAILPASPFPILPVQSHRWTCSRPLSMCSVVQVKDGSVNFFRACISLRLGPFPCPHFNGASSRSDQGSLVAGQVDHPALPSAPSHKSGLTWRQHRIYCTTQHAINGVLEEVEAGPGLQRPSWSPRSSEGMPSGLTRLMHSFRLLI